MFSEKLLSLTKEEKRVLASLEEEVIDVRGQRMSLLDYSERCRLRVLDLKNAVQTGTLKHS